MKTYYSQTKNGGKTIILDSVEDAIALVKNDVHCQEAIQQIRQGIGLPDEEIERLVDELQDLVKEMQPSLAASYKGFQRAENGITADAGLLASSDPQPCFVRRSDGEEPKTGVSGEGAYRILINTDVSWWGNPAMNAGCVAALALILNQFHPVEVWVQQVWLSGVLNDEECRDENGVTLFKVDFAGGFSVNQLSFWITSKFKDCPFSKKVNEALGRCYNLTSAHAEIECDLFLRGDWMFLAGIGRGAWVKATPFERMDIMAKWIAETAMKIVFSND